MSPSFQRGTSDHVVILSAYDWNDWRKPLTRGRSQAEILRARVMFHSGSSSRLYMGMTLRVNKQNTQRIYTKLSNYILAGRKWQKTAKQNNVKI